MTIKLVYESSGDVFTAYIPDYAFNSVAACLLDDDSVIIARERLGDDE